uniref:Uncharacterized protein n=1 Tax=Ciona savignyi TaxID=51511 RepID=H2YNV2_CIOSA
MKPSWQSQHCPTSSSNSPHHPSSRIETSQPQISSSPVTDPSHVLSQLFAQQQQNAMHPSYLAMFSKPSDQRLAFDPRMQIPVIPHPRSQMLGMQHPSLSSGNPYQQRRSAPQRVSLRRDIDIAGERDKDSPASAGIGASYPYSGDPLLHSQIPSSSR